ncbi:MAG: RidA family protein, partial [Anaerolineaceae bacterium]
KTHQVIGETIEEQTEQTLENIRHILEAAGASMENVVKATVHLSDMALFSGFDQVYSRYFPNIKPVRTTVGSQLKGILIEIDVIAYTDKS